jgi:hypothetical protein
LGRSPRGTPGNTWCSRNCARAREVTTRHSQKSQAHSISFETMAVARSTISGVTRTVYSCGSQRERAESGIVKRSLWFSRKPTSAMEARPHATSLQLWFTRARMRGWMRKGSSIHRNSDSESRGYAFAGSSLLHDAFPNPATWLVKRSNNYSARQFHDSSPPTIPDGDPVIEVTVLFRRRDWRRV